MRLLKQLLLSICLLCSAVCFADDITWSLSTNYSTYQSYSLSNANDGNTSTYFWSAEAQASGKYVLVTFSDYVDMTSFSTYSSKSTDYPNPCNELQVSDDGSNWTTIGTFQASQTSTFSNIDAKGIKYARIYATSSVEYWLVINEITIEGTVSTYDTSGYSLVYSSETAERASQELTLTEEELAKCKGSFNGQATLERYWEYCPKRSATWNKRMGANDNLDAKRLNVGYDNGTLNLYANVPEDSTSVLTSGVQTLGNFQYGIFEFKAKTKAHTGNFPALWLMPEAHRGGDTETCIWPYCGEIDVMEMVNNSYTAYGTLHNATCKCASGQSGDYSGNIEADENYHIYTLVWTEDCLTWYMDGKMFYKYKKNDTDAFPYNEPYYIIVNQSVGDGSWASNPDESFEYEMDVEYVRVYQDENGIINEPSSEVTITRSVTPGEYVSFALPFDINVRELDTYFEKVYQVSGTLFEDLWIGEDTGDPDEGGGGIGESKPTRFESMRKAAAEEEYVSENIPEDYSVHPPFAVYLNTTKSPATYHIFCHQIPKANSDGDEYFIEAGQAFYAKVKGGVREVTFTGEVAESEFVSGLDYGLTVCNYIDDASTTNTLSDYGVLESEEKEDVYVYTYNADGTFTQAETNALEANHAYIISDDADINIVVHYGSFENNVDMVKTVTRGDANRDGEVNVADMTVVIANLLGQDVSIDAIAADVNDDDSISLDDITVMENDILGK